MNYVETVENFFTLVKSYIESLLCYLTDDELINLLGYLFNCFPRPVQVVFFLLLLFLLLLVLFRIFNN